MHQPFDHNSIRHRFDRVTAGYGDAAYIFERTARGVVERLEPLTLKPLHILDMGAGEGYLTRQLAKRYPRANITVQDRAAESLKRAVRRGWWQKQHSALNCDMRELPLADNSVDLVGSSLALQWLGEPDAALQEVARVLRPEGACLLAVPGPRSFSELRSAWQRIDGRPRIPDFFDLHDFGDALSRAGLTSIVADADVVTLEYATGRQLGKELRASASGNPFVNRSPGLFSPRRWEALLKALGPPPIRITMETVYAHAFKPKIAEHRGTNGEFSVDIGEIRKRDRHE